MGFSGGTSPVFVSITAGKVALINNQTAPTPCGAGGNSIGGVFVDVLGYGPTAAATRPDASSEAPRHERGAFVMDLRRAAAGERMRRPPGWVSPRELPHRRCTLHGIS